jgi:aminoglycoside 3-N-acetyltransferase
MSRTPEIIPTVLSDLRRMGVCAGDCLIVHSSFKAMGLSGPTPADVVRTLLEALGPEGTLVMPAFTYTHAKAPGVTPFNPRTSPGRQTGILAETLRQLPNAVRSAQPTHSVAAVGRHAVRITRGKASASPIGKGSSWEEICRLDGAILLVGVGNNRNTMLHYAEAKAELPYLDVPFKASWGNTALVEKGGRPVEVALPGEWAGCSAGFGVVDGYLERQGILKRGQIGAAAAMRMRAQHLVDAVVARLRQEPDWLLCGEASCEACTLRRARLRELGRNAVDRTLSVC